MIKSKKQFICQSCGNIYSRWIGKCEQCNQWNTIAEENNSKPSGVLSKSKGKRINFEKLNDVNYEYSRIKTNINELDRVLGGGFVSGSVTLIGGDPGIGKSTLLLQLVGKLSDQKEKCIYVSGEESLSQIKMRADRLGVNNNDIEFASITNASDIAITINSEKERCVLVIDSIQTMYLPQLDSSPGTVSQVRASAHELILAAKKTNTILILIGHLTKDGAIAGPKVLEHMVDTVLQFEGDRNHLYRILRVKKNRFGSTNEIGIYEMITEGLKEIINPSEILIGNSDQKLSGTAICASVEGSRPFLIEVQALVSTAVYGTPQRSTMGINTKRLNMLLAVLEKRAGFHLASKDIFLNITGGLKVEDTGTDLAIIVAILSSNNNIKVPEDYCFAAEVGLSGEVRPVNRVDQRVKEAEKLGFSKIFISKYCDSVITKKIKVINLSSIEDLINKIS